MIWQKGIDIVRETYLLAKELPSSEKFGITSQMTRAASSIPSNIAEGSSRSSNKDYCRFLEIALGSAFELETHLIIIKEIGLIDQKIPDSIFQLIDEEQKMIMSFLKKLLK